MKEKEHETRDLEEALRVSMFISSKVLQFNLIQNRDVNFPFERNNGIDHFRLVDPFPFCEFRMVRFNVHLIIRTQKPHAEPFLFLPRYFHKAYPAIQAEIIGKPTLVLRLDPKDKPFLLRVRSAACTGAFPWVNSPCGICNVGPSCRYGVRQRPYRQN